MCFVGAGAYQMAMTVCVIAVWYAVWPVRLRPLDSARVSTNRAAAHSSDVAHSAAVQTDIAVSAHTGCAAQQSSTLPWSEMCLFSIGAVQLRSMTVRCQFQQCGTVPYPVRPQSSLEGKEQCQETAILDRVLNMRGAITEERSGVEWATHSPAAHTATDTQHRRHFSSVSHTTAPLRYRLPPSIRLSRPATVISLLPSLSLPLCQSYLTQLHVTYLYPASVPQLRHCSFHSFLDVCPLFRVVMLSFARLCFLLLGVSLLFGVSLAANLQYTIYSGTTCTGSSLASGQDNSPTYSSSSGTSVWVGSCVTVSGVTGIGSAQFGCSSGNTALSQAAFFTDTKCSTGAANALGSGSGTCAAVNGASTPESVTITCNGNGAFAMAALSLPLLAILALLATLSM